MNRFQVFAQHKEAIIWAAALLLLTSVAFMTLSSDTILAKSNNEDEAGPDEQTIRDFIAAFNQKDIDKVMAFFTDDAVYHNMPTGPVTGTKAVRGLITGFVMTADEVNWEILNIAQTGSTVLTERIDRFIIKGKPVELPIMGAFDMSDGKIAAWRDYFDMATWQRQNSK